MSFDDNFIQEQFRNAGKGAFMARLDGFELPDFIVRTMKVLIEELPPENVLTFAKAQPDLFPGYRLIRKNTALFSKRMLDFLSAAEKTVPEPLLVLLAYNPLNQHLISQLPLESLEIFLDDFRGYYGDDIFLTFLLCDDRQEVRQLVYDLLAEIEDDDSTGGDDAEEEVEPGQDQRLKKLKQELAETKKTLAGYRKREKRLQEKIERVREELAGTSEKFRAQKDRTVKVQEELAEVQRELAELHEVVEQKIQSGIDAGMRERIRGWLGSPEAVQEKLRLIDSLDILDRVATALTHQAEVDRHFGNLRELQQRLSTLEKARQDLISARKEALRVVPELEPLTKELDREINSLRQRLGMEKPVGHSVKQWLVRINDAKDIEELNKIDHFVREMASFGTLMPDDVQCIRKQICEARDRCIDFASFILAEKTEKRDQKIIIVDGHNVILGPDSFYLFGSSEHELTEPEKRDDLIRLTSRAFAGVDKVTVRIMYDSPTYSENRIAENITVIYSGGGDADQRADDAIVEMLHGSLGDGHTKSKIRCQVVTNDQELSRRVFQAGAEVMSVFEFSGMLRRYSDRN